VVAVRAAGRPPEDVLADLIEGVIVANELTGEAAAGARRRLETIVADVSRGVNAA
jgi:hypothetical protein